MVANFLLSGGRRAAAGANHNNTNMEISSPTIINVTSFKLCVCSVSLVTLLSCFLIPSVAPTSVDVACLCYLLVILERNFATKSLTSDEKVYLSTTIGAAFFQNGAWPRRPSCE